MLKTKLSVKDLRDLCKKKGIKGYSKWKKSELEQHCLNTRSGSSSTTRTSSKTSRRNSRRNSRRRNSRRRNSRRRNSRRNSRRNLKTSSTSSITTPQLRNKKYTINELRELCKKKGIKGYSKWKKILLEKYCLHGNPIQKQSPIKNLKQSPINSPNKNILEIFYKHLSKQIHAPIKLVKSTDLDIENFRESLPLKGPDANIKSLLNILHAGNYNKNIEDILNLKKISDFPKIQSKTIGSLKDYYQRYRVALQQHFLKMLKKAEIVEHDDKSMFSTQYITEGVWNSLGYTQVEKHPNTTQKRQESIKKGQWATNLGYDNSVSLFDLANFPVKPVKDKEILMFHGSSSDMINSLSSGIDWTKGGGLLGTGFYLAFNPNEAKLYACDRSIDRNTQPIILEIVIKNSDVFKHRTTPTNSIVKSWQNPSYSNIIHRGGDFVRNNSSEMFEQIAVREKVISNMEIKRIHVFKKGSMIHHQIGYDIFSSNITGKPEKCTKPLLF